MVSDIPPELRANATNHLYNTTTHNLKFLSAVAALVSSPMML